MQHMSLGSAGLAGNGAASLQLPQAAAWKLLTQTVAAGLAFAGLPWMSHHLLR